MTTATLQEYAYLTARAAAIAERLATLETELETNPDVVGQVVQIDGYGKAEVVAEQKRYSRRYTDADKQALRDRLPEDLFEEFFVDRSPRVEVSKMAIDNLRKSNNPDVMARRDEFDALLDELDAAHRAEWEAANTPRYHFHVSPSETLVEQARDELRAEVALLLASEEPVARLAVEEPARQVEVRLNDPYGE